MEQVKCPECGGTKCTALNNETYRCLYCGTTIKVKSEAEVKQTVLQSAQPVAQQPQVVVQVQVPSSQFTQVPQQPEQQQKEIKIKTGVGTYLAIFLFCVVGIILICNGLRTIGLMIIMFSLSFLYYSKYSK